MKITFKIIVLAIIFISCKELSEKQIESKNLEEVERILIEKSSYSETVREFSDFLCDCIETKETTSNFAVLNSQYDYCTKQYINKYKDELSELVRLIGSKLEENHSEYENGKTTGNIIAREGNIILARNCTFFQTEFEKIKHEIAKSIDSNSSNYKSKIQMLKNKIKNSKSEVEIQQLTSIVGVIYELNDNYDEANQTYRIGAEIESKQNLNRIFLELLKVKLK